MTNPTAARGATDAPAASDDPLARTPLLVAFDLDDTLAPSKSAVPDAMVARLRGLLDVAQVAVISGGRFAQFHAQLVSRLGDTDAGRLRRLHLLPACGTQYYRYVGADAAVADAGTTGGWHREYAETLGEEEKARATAAVESAARTLGLWTANPWGAIIEDRESQITFSALGQEAPVDAKAAWDPDGVKRRKLRTAVAEQLPGLEVRAGGSTSIDITRPGIDKAYGMRKLAELTGIGLDDMLFIGDRLDPDGNDYPVKALGVRCIAVSGHLATPALVDRVIARIAD